MATHAMAARQSRRAGVAGAIAGATVTAPGAVSVPQAARQTVPPLKALPKLSTKMQTKYVKDFPDIVLRRHAAYSMNTLCDREYNQFACRLCDRCDKVQCGVVVVVVEELIVAGS